MDDQQLVERLLERQESDDLDFKSQQYRFDSDYLKSEFIKDVVAMANTPRSESSYILLGVEEQAGKAIDIPGVTEHHDEATLGGIISSRVDRPPRFTYRQVTVEGIEFGLIEIPADQPRPIVSRSRFGILSEGAVYIRRNTANVVAQGEELRRISQSGNDDVTSVGSTTSGAWEEFYRACDGFDPSRIYIAILDRQRNSDARDWAAMASIHWSLVVDFDTETDTFGNYATAQGPFGERYGLRLTALNDSPEITTRSTLWVAAKGLVSMPSTDPSRTLREWNQRKVPQIERIMNRLAQITEPKPVTVIVFGGEESYVGRACEIAERAFGSRVEHVMAAPDSTGYENIKDDYLRSSIYRSAISRRRKWAKGYQSEGWQSRRDCIPKV